MKKSLFLIFFAFLIAVFSINPLRAADQYQVESSDVEAASGSSASKLGKNLKPGADKGIAWYVSKNGWESENCKMGRFADHKCWSCPLFISIFNTASILTSTSFGTFSKSLRAIVVLATAIWLALYLLKKLPEFSAIDWRKMVEETSGQIFRTLFVVIVLSSSFSTIRSLTLDPVFETGMRITQYFAGNYECKNAGQGINGSGLSASMGESLVCSVYNIEMEALQIVDLGKQAWCLSTDDSVINKLKVLTWPIFPNVHFLTSGLAYMILGLFFLIGCPFLLIDCVVNLLFAGALIPFGIACFAFEKTKQHLKKIWGTFMAAAFNFLFMSLVLYVMFQCVEYIIFGDTGTGTGKLYTGESSEGTGIPYMMLHVGVSTMNFFKIGFIFMLGWSALSGINDFANDFAGSAGGSSGGINVAKGMGSGLGTTALDVGKKTALKTKERVHTLRKTIRANQLARKAGPGGQITQTKTYGRFRSLFHGGWGHRVTVRESYDNGVLTTEKIRERSNGKSRVISSEKNTFS